MALTKTQVSGLYVAIFDRASEGEGNKYWQTNQPDMTSTANAMLNTPDAKVYFGTSLDSDQAFIEHIYKNTLNKTATDDPDGIAYWVKELSNGKSRGEVVATLIQAVADYKDSTDAKTAVAYAQFNNRVAVSDYTADHLEKAPTNYATSLNFGKDLTVTDDKGTVTTADNAVDTLVAAANPALAMTTSADTIVGTSGDDVIDANVVTNSINGDNEDTMTSIDSVDGGTGTDTINIQNMGDNTKDVSMGAIISNVENINYTAFGNITYDMSNTTGATKLVNQNSVATLTVTGASELELGLKNINNKTTDITFADAAYATASDSATINLNNATNQANLILNAHTTSNDIETLNIVSSIAANKIDLAGSALDNTTKLVVTGDKDLSIDAYNDNDGNGTVGTTGTAGTATTTEAMGALKTVDASAFTGKLDLDLSKGNEVNLDITGGTGDDKITMHEFTKDDKIDLGDGKDRVDITLNSDVTTAASITNVETLTLDASADVTVKLEGVTSLEELNVKTGGQTVTVTKAVASAKTINVLNSTTATDVTLDSVSFALKDSTGTADSLTVNVKTIDANENAANMADTKQATMASLSANGIESITLNTTGLGKDDTSTTTVKEGGLVLNSLSTDTMQTLTITGDTYIKIDNQLDNSLATIDASGAAGGVNLDISAIADADDDNTSTYSVTTGAGDDTLNNISDAARGTIKTGDGKDSLTLTSATTTGTGFTTAFDNKVAIDMGAGDDKVSVTTATAFTSGSTLDMGEGSDTLTITTSNTQNIDLTNLTLSNTNKIILDGTGTATYTLNLASLEDQTIEITNVASTTTTGIVVGTSTNDTIDLSLSDTYSFKGIDFIGDNNLVGVNGGAGDDTIIGNSLANVITGGTGADKITAGTGTDTIVQSDGDSGAYNTTSAKVASTTNFDILNVNAGDKIDLTASVGDEANHSTFTTAAAGADLTATIGAKTIGQFIGSYDSSANTFTSDTTGDDLLLLYVNDDGTTADEGIILVGQTNVMADSEVTAGIITIA